MRLNSGTILRKFDTSTISRLFFSLFTNDYSRSRKDKERKKEKPNSFNQIEYLHLIRTRQQTNMFFSNEEHSSRINFLCSPYNLYTFSIFLSIKCKQIHSAIETDEHPNEENFAFSLIERHEKLALSLFSLPFFYEFYSVEDQRSPSLLS